MKKALFLFFLIVSCFNLKVVNGNYGFPGGKNYFNPENFEFSNSNLRNIRPILVKPNTDYVFSIPDYAVENGRYMDIFYYNSSNEELGEHELTDSEFSFKESDRIYYVSFHTPLNAEYIFLYISHVEQGWLYDKLYGTQIEEGTIPTKYEPYVSGYIDINSPEMSGIGTITFDVDCPEDVDYLKSLLVAYDDIDKDITDKIEILTDNYTGNEHIVGDYEVVFKVEDSAKNIATGKIVVKIRDFTDPAISGPDLIEIVYPNTFTDIDILSKYYASDNYDGEITEKVKIFLNNYEVNKLILGTYEIVLQVEDNAGNKSEKYININVVDRSAPLFSGPTTFETSYLNVLSIETLLKDITVMDDTGGNITDLITIVSDDYSLSAKKLGLYQIVLKAEDLSGNSSTYSLSVRVIDDESPILYVDSMFVKVYIDETLELNDLLNWLYKTKVLNSGENYKVTVISDNYTRFKNQEGKYLYRIKLESEKHVVDKSFLINVVSRNVNFFKPDIEKKNIVLPYVITGVGVLAATISFIFLLIKRRKI